MMNDPHPQFIFSYPRFRRVDDPRYNSGAARTANRAVRLAEQAAEIVRYTSADILGRLDDNQVPSGPVNYPRARVLTGIVHKSHPLLRLQFFAAKWVDTLTHTLCILCRPAGGRERTAIRIGAPARPGGAASLSMSCSGNCI